MTIRLCESCGERGFADDGRCCEGCGAWEHDACRVDWWEDEKDSAIYCPVCTPKAKADAEAEEAEAHFKDWCIRHPEAAL